MTALPETVTIQDVLSLARFLSDEDREWLSRLLNRLEETPLPEKATIEEAIALYLADACSLGRAAELACVTRWDLIDQLTERGIPYVIHHTRSAQEVDLLSEELEREGFL